MTAVLDAPEQGSAAAAVPGRPARSPWWFVVLVVTAVAVAARVIGLAQGPQYSDDEGTYVAQAWAVVHNGTLAHYTYWYDHPPLGWLVIAAWQALTAPFLHPATAVLGGRQLMVVLSAVDAALLVVVARRLGLRCWAAATAGLLWALSPLAVSYSRSVWLDDVALAFALGAVACALSPRRHLWAFAGAGVLLGCAILSKETALLLAPAVVVAVLRTSKGRTQSFCLAAFSVSALLVVLAYPLLAVLKGELLPGPGHVSLLEAVGFQLYGRQSTGSPLDPSSASAALVTRWLQMDPWLLGAGALLAPIAFAVRRLRVPALAVLAPVVMALRPGYLPEPYVVALLPFCALVVAGLLDVALPRRLTATGPVLVAGLVATLLGALWMPGLARLRDEDATGRTLAAEEWVAAHVPHQDRLLVDDSVWLDLVHRGFNPHLGVVWFYKTDFVGGLDPSVRRALPGGYRDVQWVVVSPIMRSALAQNPSGLSELRKAINHSTVVHTTGSGVDRFEIRRVRP
ncbi:MAG: glycosyltransferase family 39 protein [Mycobacteriales bacterium]